MEVDLKFLTLSWSAKSVEIIKILRELESGAVACDYWHKMLGTERPLWKTYYLSPAAATRLPSLKPLLHIHTAINEAPQGSTDALGLCRVDPVNPVM